MKILRCGDQFNWAYDFLTKEYAKYSKHEIRYVNYLQVQENLDWADIVYIHSPDITTWHAIKLPKIAHSKGKKVITQYSGNPKFWSEHEKPIYSYSDLVVTISPQLYQFAKNHYHNVPIIYMPESVDTNFFSPDYPKHPDIFVVGWAGGFHKKIKRGYLLEKLDFPIKIQDTWKDNRNKANHNETVSLDAMRDFYNSISCLVVTSLSECMPRVVMEVMSCGIPVIGTDVGSMRLLLDNKFIVPVNPEEQTITEINKLLHILNNDQKYRECIGLQNRIKVHHNFSWESNYQLWDKMYELIYKNETGIIELSEKWLDKFRLEFNSSIEEVTEQSENLSDMEIKDIIRYLNDNNIDYYLLQSSCLDCIRYQQLQVKKDCLILGGNLSELSDALKTIGFTQSDNIYTRKNIVVNLDGIIYRNTKRMPFYGLQTRVPYPVVGYLESIYGKNWSTT